MILDEAERNMTRIIGIVSGKGGVGKSTVAVNLALALRKFKKNVALIDCNLSTPHLSYYLGISDYETTINDVLQDKLNINSAMYSYNGIKYLPASVKFEDLVGVELTKFKKYLSKVEKKIDFVILDSAPGLGKEALFVMDASSEIIFVTTPFVPMISDIIRCKEVLSQFGQKKMNILLNMVTGNNYELKKEVVEELTGVPVMGELAYDKNIIQGLVFRTPVIEYKPNSLSSINFMKIASLLAEKDYEIPMKIKWHKLFTKIKNLFLPSGITMSSDSEEVKRELLSNY